MNGMECCFAIIATSAVPALEYTAPFVWMECAPTITAETSVMTEPTEGRRRYLHSIPARERTDKSRFPATKTVRI